MERGGITMKRDWFTAKFLAFAVIALLGVGSDAAEAPLRVGSTNGPYAEIMDFVAGLAAKQGLPIKVVEFTDYAIPNVALANGEIDVSNFQTVPYMENAIKARGYDIVALQPSLITPLGIYSKKITSIDALKNGDTLAIANDPSNGARGLLLLQKAGLIKLKTGVTTTATVPDIVENPKHLKFRELDAAQIPRSLDDVTAAAVNMSYAIPAGIDPKTALVREGTDTLFALYWTCLRKDRDNPRIGKLIAIYRSPEVKSFILAHFNGSIIPAW
jgi:D-methionine transport system substrate-binding protein